MSSQPYITVPLFNKKEIQVIRLICKQYTNQEIAAKVKLSKRTVEGYKIRILAKTKAKNSVGILLYALRNELVKI